MKIRMAALVAAVLAAASVSVFAQTKPADAEEEISLDKAPQAVQDAVKKAVGDGKLEGFYKQSDEGKVTYEADIEGKDGDSSATFADDGKLLEKETEVDVDKLPKDVSGVALKGHGDGKIDSCYKVEAEGKTYWEVDVKVGEKMYEVDVSPDLSVMSDTAVEPEKDAKDEKKEKN